jgi:putative effector of murein hydrolase LrgA (UPF0299 family)
MWLITYRLLSKGVCQVGPSTWHIQSTKGRVMLSTPLPCGVMLVLLWQLRNYQEVLHFFFFKFTVASKAFISQLVVDLVPPVVGTVQYMDQTLDYWYKDLEGLLTGQIAR